jgi:hypothetical protein
MCDNHRSERIAHLLPKNTTVHNADIESTDKYGIFQGLHALLHVDTHTYPQIRKFPDLAQLQVSLSCS